MVVRADLLAVLTLTPTADSIASAILLAVTPAADPGTLVPPDDHGLDDNDPAVTGIPRDETTPTAGVDLPPVIGDDSVAAPSTDDSLSAPATEDTISGGAGDDSLSPLTPVTEPTAPAVTGKRARDQAAVDADEVRISADQDQLAADEATLSEDPPE